MIRNELIKNLEYTKQKYKDKFVMTGETNVYEMVSDMLRYLNQPTTEINIDYYEELKRKADFVDKMISPSANDIYKELNELKVKADKYDDCKVFIDLSLDMFASFLNSKTPFPVPVISLKQFQELKVKTDAYDKIMALTGTNDARLELTDKGAEELRHYLDKVREVTRCKK